MAQGIQDFYETLQTRGLARDFQFRIIQMGDYLTENTSDLFAYCRGFEIPKREIKQDKLNFRGFEFNIPFDAKYGEKETNITFLNDRDQILYSILEMWQVDVYDEHSGISNISDQTLVLDLLNDSQRSIKRYTLRGVSVKNLNPSKYDLSGNGKPLDFSTTISFQWVESKLIPGEDDDDRNIFDIITDGIRGVSDIGGRVGRGVRGVRNVLDRF